MSTRDVPDQVGDLPRIGRPATSALLAQGITTLDQVDAYGTRNLLRIHGVGPKAVRLLDDALAARSDQPRVVRLFNEYGVDWPMWGPDGLTVREDWPQVPDALAAQLRSWGENFNDHYDPFTGWPDPHHRSASAAEGRRLARHMQTALGRAWEVRLELWETLVAGDAP